MLEELKSVMFGGVDKNDAKRVLDQRDKYQDRLAQIAAKLGLEGYQTPDQLHDAVQAELGEVFDRLSDAGEAAGLDRDRLEDRTATPLDTLVRTVLNASTREADAGRQEAVDRYNTLYGGLKNLWVGAGGDERDIQNLADDELVSTVIQTYLNYKTSQPDARLAGEDTNDILHTGGEGNMTNPEERLLNGAPGSDAPTIGEISYNGPATPAGAEGVEPLLEPEATTLATPAAPAGEAPSLDTMVDTAVAPPAADPGSEAPTAAPEASPAVAPVQGKTFTEYLNDALGVITANYTKKLISRLYTLSAASDDAHSSEGRLTLKQLVNDMHRDHAGLAQNDAGAQAVTAFAFARDLLEGVRVTDNEYKLMLASAKRLGELLTNEAGSTQPTPERDAEGRYNDLRPTEISIGGSTYKLNARDSGIFQPEYARVVTQSLLWVVEELVRRDIPNLTDDALQLGEAFRAYTTQILSGNRPDLPLDVLTRDMEGFEAWAVSRDAYRNAEVHRSEANRDKQVTYHVRTAEQLKANVISVFDEAKVKYNTAETRHEEAYDKRLRDPQSPGRVPKEHIEDYITADEHQDDKRLEAARVEAQDHIDAFNNYKTNKENYHRAKGELNAGTSPQAQAPDVAVIGRNDFLAALDYILVGTNDKAPLVPEFAQGWLEKAQLEVDLASEFGDYSQDGLNAAKVTLETYLGKLDLIENHIETETNADREVEGIDEKQYFGAYASELLRIATIETAHGKKEKNLETLKTAGETLDNYLKLRDHRHAEDLRKNVEEHYVSEMYGLAEFVHQNSGEEGKTVAIDMLERVKKVASTEIKSRVLLAHLRFIVGRGHVAQQGLAIDESSGVMDLLLEQGVEDVSRKYGPKFVDQAVQNYKTALRQVGVTTEAMEFEEKYGNLRQVVLNYNLRNDA